MAREVLSNGVINPDKYQADWYADLSNNWNLLNNLIGSAISGSEVDSKIATAIQELMVRTFQIVTELPVTGTEGVMYLVSIPDTSKYTAYVWENNAYRELGVIQMTITIDDELSTTSENPAQNKVITNALNNKAPISHTHSASDITSGLATVATSGSYNDLSNKPTIPTVNNATLTIQKNGTTVDTFTANSSSDKTVNIQCVDLTNNQTVAGNKEFTGTTTAHDVVPSATDTYNFGSSSYQWNNAYIKSLTINGVACGDILTHNASEFVDVTSNQTIGGVKTFSNIIYGLGGQIILRQNNVERTVLPASTVYTSFSFNDKSGVGTGSRFGAVENVVKTNGDINLDLRAYDFSTKSNTHTTVVLERKYDGTSSFYPEQNNTVNLGTSTNKWKSFNGINPGALSLQGTGVIDISSSITVLDGTTTNKFTPQINGWLHINGTGTDAFIYAVQGRVGMKSAGNQTSLRCAVFIPVVAGVEVAITCKLGTLTWANITPCQGNV